MNDVSTLRLYVLRGTYLFVFVGLALLIWPGVLSPPADLEHMRGVVRSLLAAVSLLALIGIRYPLQMLPVLLFELTWKSIWLIAFGIPAWSRGALEGGRLQTWYDCLLTLPLFLVAIPWGYVWKHYVKQPGDRWRSASSPPAEAQNASRVAVT